LADSGRAKPGMNDYYYHRRSKMLPQKANNSSGFGKASCRPGKVVICEKSMSETALLLPQ
jgi:hypothetical protein